MNNNCVLRDEGDGTEAVQGRLFEESLQQAANEAFIDFSVIFQHLFEFIWGNILQTVFFRQGEQFVDIRRVDTIRNQGLKFFVLGNFLSKLNQFLL